MTQIAELLSLLLTLIICICAHPVPFTSMQTYLFQLDELRPFISLCGNDKLFALRKYWGEETVLPELLPHLSKHDDQVFKDQSMMFANNKCSGVI